MSKQTRTRVLSLSLMIWILWCINAPTAYAQNELWGNQYTGPWIDKIVNKPHYEVAHHIESLLAGEIDIIGNNIFPGYPIDELRDAEGIEIFDILRFGYGITSINCAKYPMNITNFRRAVAFALNKHTLVDECWEGYAHLLDCHIPRQHPASIEEEMTYHYYDEDIMKGLELLADAGFADSDHDGWLEGPSLNGPGTIELDTIRVQYAPGRIELAAPIYHALLNLGIPAELTHTPFQEYEHQLHHHCDYDMVFYGINWNTLDLDWYARDYLSENIHVPFRNTENWINETWDSLAEVVLHSTDLDEIIQTAKQMEHIWVYECPAIIMYQDIYFLIQSTDTFSGIEPTAFFSSRAFWTNMRVHKKEGSPLGGTFIWGIEQYLISSFSPFAYDRYASDMIYDSLVKQDPDGEDIFWMCEDVTILTHSDDSSILEGHTRILVDVVQNATWSDGVPITAEDFVFSLNFLLQYVPFQGLEDLIACYAPTTYKLVCEFDTESVWNWHNIAYRPLIPKQVWADYGANYWQKEPSPETIDEMVVSGPFKPTVWIYAEFEELTQNPDYFRNPRKIMPIPETTSTTTSTSSTSDSSRFLIGIIAGTIGAAIVITAGGYLIFQYTSLPKDR